LTKNPYLFQGQRLDEETGLYYFKNRYYDPVHGRFISRDPEGMVDGPNLYAFVNNNPVNFVDPLGLMAGVAARRMEQEILLQMQADELELKLRMVEEDILKSQLVEYVCTCGALGPVEILSIFEASIDDAPYVTLKAMEKWLMEMQILFEPLALKAQIKSQEAQIAGLTLLIEVKKDAAQAKQALKLSKAYLGMVDEKMGEASKKFGEMVGGYVEDWLVPGSLGVGGNVAGTQLENYFTRIAEAKFLKAMRSSNVRGVIAASKALKTFGNLALAYTALQSAGNAFVRGFECMDLGSQAQTWLHLAQTEGMIADEAVARIGNNLDKVGQYAHDYVTHRQEAAEYWYVVNKATELLKRVKARQQVVPRIN
jgi:RHS repeat-associated protein